MQTACWPTRREAVQAGRSYRTRRHTRGPCEYLAQITEREISCRWNRPRSKHVINHQRTVSSEGGEPEIKGLSKVCVDRGCVESKTHCSCLITVWECVCVCVCVCVRVHLCKKVHLRLHNFFLRSKLDLFSNSLIIWIFFFPMCSGKEKSIPGAEIFFCFSVVNYQKRWWG